eukprot:COSAG02_NODE_46721_length_346_cov_1.469636_2_plen_39_part_01
MYSMYAHFYTSVSRLYVRRCERARARRRAPLAWESVVDV